MAKLWSNPEIHQGRRHIAKTSPRAYPYITENHGDSIFYAKEINLTIMVALGKFSAEQTSGEIETENPMHKLLDCCATHPSATLQYRASRMVIKAHRVILYFSE